MGHVHVPSKTRKKVEWLLRRAEGALLPDRLLAAEGAHLDPDEARRTLAEMGNDVAALGVDGRLAHLAEAAGDTRRRSSYIDAHGVAGVTKERAGADTLIFCLAVETFPHHVNNVYVFRQDGRTFLFDCGSGRPSSRRDIALGFAVLREAFGEDLAWSEVDRCVVSHAHYDHFGGANAVKAETRASLAVHELDARVLACFGERIVVAAKDNDVFWRRAGVPDEERGSLLALYLSAKSVFQAEEVDHVLRDGDVLAAGVRVHHVPGHCPGLICLQVHDVLLTSDHVLSRTTPHQFPQAITPLAGLGHYFHSLAKIRELGGIRIALGGHEEPIPDLAGRTLEIEAFHRERLEKVLALCSTPRTVLQVARDLFGPQEGYGRILALDEAGAHVEYLHELGRLRIANLEEVARLPDPAIEYVRK